VNVLIGKPVSGLPVKMSVFSFSARIEPTHLPTRHFPIRFNAFQTLDWRQVMRLERQAKS